MSEQSILNEISTLKDLITGMIKKREPKEWESITKASKILGIPKDDIDARIQNAQIPFRKNGTRYSVNIKLVRAILCREDMENMKTVQRAIKSQPMSRQKMTGDINNKQRPKQEPKVRRQGA